MEIFAKNPPKEKRPHGRPRRWTNEFMTMVAQKVVDEGMTYQKAGKIFGVSQGSIGTWVKRYKQGTLSASSKTKEASPELQIYRLEGEVKELKQEIGNLYIENQLLKKALCHSHSKKRETSSVITSENLAQFQRGVE